MVKLINIKKNSSVAECDILPEDSIHSGHLIVDLKTEEITDYTLPKGYEWCRNHVNHAASELMKLSKEKQFPNEWLVMWC